MESRYKVILSNRDVYKEIEITPDMQSFKVGTGSDCDVRLRRDLFFGRTELHFSRSGGEWSVLCPDELYISVGGARKLLTKKLSHGDILQVRYQSSDSTAFTFEFLIDFDSGKQKYERGIDLSSASVVTIGSSGGENLVLGSRYVANDSVSLRKHGSGLVLDVAATTYGVYHNGRKVDEREVVESGDFFSLSDYFFYYRDGVLWTEKRSDMAISGLQYTDSPDRGSYPRFNRNTRVRTTVDTDKIDILDPPPKPQKPKNSIVTRLLPSMGMLLAAGIMAYMGGTMIIFSAVSGVMAVLTTVLTMRERKNDYKKGTAERIEKYNAYIENKRAEVARLREAEKRALEELYISEEAAAERFDAFSPDLFDRTGADADFLCVRLGRGSVEAAREVDYKKQERLETDDELQDLPRRVYEDFRYIPDAPIVCDFKSVNAVGVIGAKEYRFELMKNIVVDIAARQYFTDVKMVFVVGEGDRDKVRWLRLLPHVYNDELGVRNIVCDDESKNLIFEYLYKELSIRSQAKDRPGSIVVFFFDEYGFKNHPISKFTDSARELGVTFVFFGDTKADIPLGCGRIISITDRKSAELIAVEDRSKALAFTYPHISSREAESIVEILAPVYTEELSLESSLTKSYSMFEMLNIIAVDDIDLAKRWSESCVFKSMAAPIGISKTGIVSLDLHDKAHGPHGLVAGTTGSGKSEILQTYILAMSTLFHPYEAAFVIIDFKGGGMVNQFKELPHLLGAITNIDGKEIDRSLKSIKAELQKRQRLFAEADVNHIDKYIKKYRAGDAMTPLPHLIIVVDEFAELKAEQPEFMKELISAARIGRSLGVHLILATQKPSGQVNEQIWSNSRFKLCLKVQSQEDSNEVLKSPLAAEIKEPGRAYLQVGNNEIFELFQSAYSGASEKADDSNVKEFSIYSLTDSGKRVPVFVQRKPSSGEGSATQLDAIVRHVAGYCRDIALARLPDICLPSLGERIDFVPPAEGGGAGYDVAIGVYDDPENQYQGVHTVDLAGSNLLIIGSSQSGKTNVLQNIIRSLSTRYSPDEAAIYIVDFASMVLKNFDRLSHVGGVVCPSEDEKLKNLFKLLHTEVEARKEKLISVGVSSFSAYREAGKTDLPLIVLIIDNLTALKELYFQDDDTLLRLCREGLTVGVSVVIANAQTAGIGYKYLSNFSARMALFCNDSSEYNSLFDHCRERIASIPGRCIIELEKRHLECQSYLAFGGEKEIDRVREIKKYIDETNAAGRGSRARRIPLIPASLTAGYMAEQFSPLMEGKLSVVAGLNYSTVMPYVVDFSALGLLAVTGRENAGRHNWLRYSAEMLERMNPGRVRLYIVDGVGKRLAPLKDSPGLAAYSMVPGDAAAYVKELEQRLAERYDALVAGSEEVLSASELLMLVIDNQDALLAICSDKDGLAAYKNITGRYKSMRACIVAFIDNAAIPYSAPEILKNIREQRHILFFDDISAMKIFDVPLAMSRSFKKPIETGDGYYIRDSECVKLKTALCSPDRAKQ